MSDDPNATSRRGDNLPPVSAVGVVGERYALGAEIARGGMGAVYRATDRALDREVAVKVLQESFALDSGTARRFADEARISAQLQHPGIPPVHDLGTLPDGRPFLAMKLIKGDTLDALLKARPDPSVERGRFVAAFEAVCQAIAYAHSRDVIHRDLKPANVMVGAFGEVQVMDWGLAKVLAGRERRPADSETLDDPDATDPNTAVRSVRDSDHLHTQAGVVLGTPAYMSPEQAVGAVTKVDARSDVFGLGAVLAVVLTGKPAFVGTSVETTRVKAAQGDVADCFARLDASGAEPELVALCKRCLSPKPADRPTDAGEVAWAVAAFRQDAEARARQAELDRAQAETKAAEQRKRRRVQLAAVVVLMATAGGVAVWRVQEAAGKRAEAVRREGEEQTRAAKAAAEDERKQQAERERKARAAGAIEGSLDQAKAALEDGDAGRAAPFLDLAARRAKDDDVPDHAARLAAYRTDLDMLRALDTVETFLGTARGSKYPTAEEVVEKWAKAFAGYGIVPGTTPPAEAAARLTASPVWSSFRAALDGWLARAPAAAADIRALLDAADPDPFRAEVRRLLAARDRAGLAALVGRAEWTGQPASLVRAYAASAAVPAEERRTLLTRALAARPADFGLLMTLGTTYPINTPVGADDRIRWYQGALAARPRNAEAHNCLALAQMDKGEWAAAIATCRAAIDLDPELVSPHVNLGNALTLAGDAAGSLAAYREAVRLDPGHAAAHYGLGNRLRDGGDPVGALAAFREAVRLDPGHAAAHNNLGNLLLKKGDPDGAMAAYREAVRIDPAFANPHYGIGNVLRDKGDLDGAVAAYHEAILRDPKFALAHYNLGNVLMARGDAAGALVAFREAVRLNLTDPLPHTNLGQTLMATGDVPGAVAAFREGIRLNPKDPLPHNNLGIALAGRGEWDGAIAEFREAIRLDPRLPLSHNNLGIALANRGDWDGAVACYREAIRLNPMNPNPFFGLGMALLNRGDWDDAAAAFREAIRLNPRNYLALGNLGVVYRKQGRLDEAGEALRTALVVQPNLGFARDELEYVRRLQRGEVPTAPPPRAVKR